MPETTKEELTLRAQMVRAFEAACKIEYPSDQERNFRIALMKKLGAEFGLREVRDKEITGPAAPPSTRTPSPGQPPKSR